MSKLKVKQVFQSKFVGDVMGDSGHIEIGDCATAQLLLPTKCGDGVYPVYALKMNGEVCGYFVNVDVTKDWQVETISQGCKKAA